ncbi:MAG: hypothetical protein AB1896_08145 [Thermodesulfobacteriota bacterium]
MKSPFPFDAVVAFGFLSILLLVGVALRAKVTMLQRFLFPSCLIGGIIGLISIYILPLGLEASRLETMAYHFFNISFISVGLTRENDNGGQPTKSRTVLRGAAWMALIQGLTFPLQAALGGLLVLLLGLFGLDLFPTFGFLAPLGFNEGPGQALSFGKVWETLGFAHGATIGLTFAALGFGFAFFVGVPLVNYGLRKGLSSSGPKEIPRDFLVGIMPRQGNREPAGALTLHSGNVETLAYQAALVGLVYLLTYFIVKFLSGLLPGDAGSMLWGFCFFFGLAVSLLVKRLMKAFGVDYLADPGVQRRITGWSVDFLIVATITAIQLKVVWAYLFPILLISLTVGVLTTLLVVFFGRRLDAYPLERTAAIYGVVTGTVSTGLLLLRIADPEFKTPAAFEVALMNVFALPIVGGCTVLVNGPLWWHWSVGLTVVVFAGVFLASLIVLRLLGFWKLTRP